MLGKTVGIVGLGNIGRRVAELAANYSACGARIDPYLSADDFKERGVEPVLPPGAITCIRFTSPRPHVSHGGNHGECERVRPHGESAYFVITARGGIIGMKARACGRPKVRRNRRRRRRRSLRLSHRRSTTLRDWAMSSLRTRLRDRRRSEELRARRGRTMDRTRQGHRPGTDRQSRRVGQNSASDIRTCRVASQIRTSKHQGANRVVHSRPVRGDCAFSARTGWDAARFSHTWTTTAATPGQQSSNKNIPDTIVLVSS